MSGQVLVVDDEAPVRELLASQLCFLGYHCRSAATGVEALRLATEVPLPELVLLDLKMPDISGLSLLRRLRDLDEHLQIVVVTGNRDIETVRRCLREGAYDYLAKPYDFDDLAQTLQRALERRRLRVELECYQQDLEELVDQRTRELRETRDVALLTLARLAECRDDQTGNHLERIRAYCEILGSALAYGPYAERIGPDFVEHLHKSSPLHDIGKVAIPDRVLLKAGPLDPEERELMKTHTVRGGDTLRGVIDLYPGTIGQGARFLRTAMEIAYYHHERWDGAGYPFGRSGSDIPLAARVVAVADAYDAITSERPYKPAYDHDEATERIRADAGSHFDPVLVDAFLSNRDRFRTTHERLRQPTVTPS